MPKSFLIKKKSKEYVNFSPGLATVRIKETSSKLACSREGGSTLGFARSTKIKLKTEPTEDQEDFKFDDRSEESSVDDLDENGNKITDALKPVCADGRSKSNGSSENKS
ncbi:hypothetical protein QZH41_009845, partial [Actinostola sp. cb2023]